MKKIILGIKFIVNFITMPSNSYFSVVEKVCLKELEKKPDDLFVKFFLSDHYAQYKKYNESLILLESLLKLGANKKEVILLLSRVYFNLNRYEDVEQLFQKYDVLNGKEVENYYLGYSLIQLDRKDEGMKYLEVYLKHYPEDHNVLAIMGYQYYKEKKYHLALESYRSAEKLNSNKQEIRESIKLCEEMIKKTVGETIH